MAIVLIPDTDWDCFRGGTIAEAFYLGIPLELGMGLLGRSLVATVSIRSGTKSESTKPAL